MSKLGKEMSDRDCRARALAEQAAFVFRVILLFGMCRLNTFYECPCHLWWGQAIAHSPNYGLGLFNRFGFSIL